MKRWFITAAARARGQSNDLNREILASNLFNCHKEVINAPPVPSISRCIHIVYRHKNVWEYQWSNFIYNCMGNFLHYVHCKDALLDCSAPGGERCESLTWVDEIASEQNYGVQLLIHVSMMTHKYMLKDLNVVMLHNLSRQNTLKWKGSHFDKKKIIICCNNSCLEVLTMAGAANNENFINMTSFSFQCTTSTNTSLSCPKQLEYYPYLSCSTLYINFTLIYYDITNNIHHVL